MLAVERFLYLESPAHHSYTSVGSQSRYHTASACDVWKFSSMREHVVCLHELFALGLSSGVAQRCMCKDKQGMPWDRLFTSKQVPRMSESLSCEPHALPVCSHNLRYHNSTLAAVAVLNNRYIAFHDIFCRARFETDHSIHHALSRCYPQSTAHR